MPLAPLVFLDTETTGLALTDDIWEFAGIRVDPDGRETRLHLFIEHDPVKALAMPERFLADLIRRYDSDRAVSQIGAATLIHDFTSSGLGQVMPHIVGAVPSFDTERLALMLRRFGLVSGWHYHLLDIEVLALGWLLGRDVEDGGEVTQWGEHLALPMRSDDLSRACGVQPPTENDRHTAMGDTEWVKRWYEAITRDTALQLPRSVPPAPDPDCTGCGLDTGDCACDGPDIDGYEVPAQAEAGA